LRHRVSRVCCRRPAARCTGSKRDRPNHSGQSSVARYGRRRGHQRSLRRGLSQNRFGWGDPLAFLENDLPGVDVSRLNVLQFRASVNFLDERNAGTQDFTVTLTDGSGNSASTTVGQNSASLYFPPGAVRFNYPLPKIFLNTVRLRLSSFPIVDLTNIQSIRFDFNVRLIGALLVFDIQFAG